jgi:hypothetical protein
MCSLFFGFEQHFAQPKQLKRRWQKLKQFSDIPPFFFSCKEIALAS